jgi:predicted HTH transcriptional regulator
MLTDAQFAEILQLPREQHSVEFKGPGLLSDKNLVVKVIKAVLGMANHRDGGLVIIGVDDDAGKPVPTGLTPEQLTSWSNYDQVADVISNFADPSVTFDLHAKVFEGKSFVVLAVEEFEDIPVLCKRDEKGLRAGACYVRPRRKPETAELPSQADMRDLLDLAIEKGVRRFISQTRAAGLSISGEVLPNDQQLFDQEVAELGLRSV